MTSIDRNGISFFAGVIGGNSIPHFVKGITKEPYPNLLGNTPVVNLVTGWTAFVIAALLGYWADVGSYPVWAFVAGALGVLLIGLFHAGPGAFGRNP
jgi:hypothetical protein